MRDCIDDGALQSYLDDELSPEMAGAVAEHLAACNLCGDALREAENEMAVYATALEPEMYLNVPTERLRRRVNAAIAQRDAPVSIPAINVESGARAWFASFDLRAWSPALSFAVFLLLIGAAIAGMKYLDAQRNAPQDATFSRMNTPSKSPETSGSVTRGTIDTGAGDRTPYGNRPSKYIHVADGRRRANRVNNSTIDAKRRARSNVGLTLAEREAAKERLMLALQIAGTKLNYTQKKVIQNIYRQPVS